MSDLERCPFCGNEANIVDDLITFYGQCDNCGATSAVSSYRSGAIEAWNRRAQPAQAGQVLTEDEIVKCLVASGCVGTVKMSYDSGPYEITRTSINADRFARAIESAVLARVVRVPQWLPIETAPKDGTPILLSREGRVTAGHWEPERYPTATEYHSTTGEYLGQFETGEVVPAWWYSEDGGFDEEHPPDHWMPLPPPPGTVGEKGGQHG